MSAYAETYLPRAQKNLAEAIDYAVNACGISADAFVERFIVSGLAGEWEDGSPRVLVGLSGTELVRDAFTRTGDVRKWPPPQQAFDLSPEYWAGWVLCYYQWWSSRSFRDIAAIATMQEIVGMYHPLHEGSENRFVDRMEGLAVRRNTLAPLKARRLLRGWSQTELASRSGVNVRNIRQYEQNPKTIRRAELSTVQSLAKALGCRMEDLSIPDVPAPD